MTTSDHVGPTIGDASGRRGIEDRLLSMQLQIDCLHREISQLRKQARSNSTSEIQIIRDGWDKVLAELSKRSQVAWAFWHNSQPLDVKDKTLTVIVKDQHRSKGIQATHRDVLLREVIIDVLRLDLVIIPAALVSPDATTAQVPDAVQFFRNAGNALNKVAAAIEENRKHGR